MCLQRHVRGKTLSAVLQNFIIVRQKLILRPQKMTGARKCETFSYGRYSTHSNSNSFNSSSARRGREAAALAVVTLFCGHGSLCFCFCGEQCGQ